LRAQKHLAGIVHCQLDEDVAVPKRDPMATMVFSLSFFAQAGNAALAHQARHILCRYTEQRSKSIGIDLKSVFDSLQLHDSVLRAESISIQCGNHRGKLNLIAADVATRIIHGAIVRGDHEVIAEKVLAIKIL